MIRTSIRNGLLLFMLLGVVTVPVHAFSDDRQQIAKQWKAHDRSIHSALRAFAVGNTNAQLEAVTGIATSEAYLAILEVDMDDPRLVAWLFGGNLRVPARVSRLFHHLLQKQTGFETSLEGIFEETPFYRVSER